MPDGAKTLLIILFIPFLFALGHDLYLNYFSDDEKVRELKALRIDPQEFLVSDTGWIWNEYSPNTMQTLRDTIEPATWTTKLDPVLQLPTMIFALIPWAITAIYLLLASLIGFWPYTHSKISLGGKNKKDKFSVYDRDRKKSYKYKKR